MGPGHDPPVTWFLRDFSEEKILRHEGQVKVELAPPSSAPRDTTYSSLGRSSPSTNLTFFCSSTALLDPCFPDVKWLPMSVTEFAAKQHLANFPLTICIEFSHKD